jgi:ribosomal protein S18 acetylase RimI-like enzyme
MIREYRPSDWPEICRVFDRSRPHELASGGINGAFLPLAKDEKRQARFAKCQTWVWDGGGKVCGFVSFVGPYIDWLYVDPEIFRQGIGRALLRFALGQIVGKPWLWSMQGNHGAIALYHSEGFEIVEVKQSESGGVPCMAVRMARNSPTKPASK